MVEDSKDPGKWKSRKLYMALLCLFLVTAGFFAREGLEGLESVYAQYVAGVLGTLTIYLGGNVGNKYVIAKSQKNNEVQQDGPNG